MSPILDCLRPRPTGGLIVTFRADADPADQARVLGDAGGGSARSVAADEMAEAEGDPAARALLLEDTGIALIPQGADTAAARARLSGDPSVEEVRPEFWMFPLDTVADTRTHTWGVTATGADRARETGRGIRLAILDTGLDFDHPDFAARPVVSRSFVAGQTALDIRGHGTHCAGTAAGNPTLSGVPRYGVAPEAELHVAKVLGDGGSGREIDIHAGMLWAIKAGCAVISMSLGRPAQLGEAPSLAYERIGRRALAQGSLIVAAAGNESSRRFGFIAPVGAPANSPSIMAVAAVDQALEVAEFSCGGMNPGGGEIDLAGPGVGVFSSYPRHELFKLLAGTSMACPHVAGLAALWAERDAGLRGTTLRDRLIAAARPLPHPLRDVGAGLAAAPTGTATADPAV